MRRLPLSVDAAPSSHEPRGPVAHDAPLLLVLAYEGEATAAFVSHLLHALPPERRPDLVIERGAAVPAALADLAHVAVADPDVSVALRPGVPAVAVLGPSARQVRPTLGVAVLPHFAAMLHPRIHALRSSLDLVLDDPRPGLARRLAETFAKPASTA